jgi:putative oxidoreductase
MNSIIGVVRLHRAIATFLNVFQSFMLLWVRFYVSWQFTKSGWLKLTSWDSTVSLFRDEYQVPLLPPVLAAVAGTAGELFFPVLLYLGLFSRIGATGLFAVNLLAVVSYAHVLLAEGFEAALGDHVLWGFMLLVLMLFGPGRISLDHYLEKGLATRCRPAIDVAAMSRA